MVYSADLLHQQASRADPTTPDVPDYNPEIQVHSICQLQKDIESNHLNRYFRNQPTLIFFLPEEKHWAPQTTYHIRYSFQPPVKNQSRYAPVPAALQSDVHQQPLETKYEFCD